jgi:hypothetical protein
MNAENEYVSNDSYTIAVTGAGENTGIVIKTKDRDGRIGMDLCDVDQFAIDLKRLKDAAETRLDGGVKFIAS